uniref:Uncharacterized protein n=1 Tax=Arundo donax TaxID=35708 RepID=A0A0A9QAT0_ARUDO
MADELSDACSCTNEDDDRARRKRRRSWAVCSYANEEERVRIMRKRRKVIVMTCFVAFVAVTIYRFIEDDDARAHLMEKALDLLDAVQVWMERELGLKNTGSEEVPAAQILAALEEIPELGEDDMSDAYDIFASDVRKFRALMGLPMDLRRKWVLMQIRKIQSEVADQHC